MEYKELPGYWEDFRVCTYLRLDEAAALLAGENPHTVVTDGLSPGKAALILREMKADLCFAIRAPEPFDDWTEEVLLRARLFESLTTILKAGTGEIVLDDEKQCLIEDDIDSSSTSAPAAFAEWADGRGIPHYWLRFGEGVQGHAIKVRAGLPFPYELQAAIDAFKAVSGNPEALKGKTPKQAITAWLEANRELSKDAIRRVAVVANWGKKGGAPVTPNRSDSAE